MRLYPDTADDRGRAVARDALTILTLIVLAWVAIKVHNAVDELAVLGTGVRDSGEVVQNGLESAGDAVDGVPVVGGELGDALRDAGEGTGGEVADAGREGEERVHDLADLLGFLFFAVPASILLVLTVPGRIRQIRELNASDRLLDLSTDERRRLVAMRAAFSLPATTLARHTRDPIGDLAEGRYEPLIAAAYDEVGLRPRA
jgi:hypothetical protein